LTAKLETRQKDMEHLDEAAEEYEKLHNDAETLKKLFEEAKRYKQIIKESKIEMELCNQKLKPKADYLQCGCMCAKETDVNNCCRYIPAADISP
jgi:hypothetical protein